MNSQQPFKFKLWRSFLISVGFWIFLFVSVPVLVVYRTLIDLVLTTKHGKKYGGLFDKADGPFLVNDPSKCCITAVMYIRSEKELDLFRIIKDILEKKIFNNSEQYPKLTSSKHHFGGYPYWIKNGYQVNDVIRPLKIGENVHFNEEYLKKCTAEITNAEHGKDGTVLWDVHISEKPLKGDYDDNCYRYPVVCRFHHSIADGTSLVALLLRIFGDETSKNYGEQLFNKRFTEVPGQKVSVGLIYHYLSKFIKALLLYLEIVFVTIGKLCEAEYLRPEDVNALHASKYSGKKIAVWSSEDHVKCVPLIKNIKNRTNTTFTSVVNTAISASMTNYFKRNNKPLPDFTTGVITLLLGFPSMEPVELKNKTTGCFVELPCTHKSNTLVEALKTVAKYMSQQMKYSDAIGARLIVSNIIGLFPLKLVPYLMSMKSYTFIVTNVPGGSQIKILDGCILEKIVPFAPNSKGIAIIIFGITLTVLSYDNQLQVGILVDKTLTESQEEVQKMAYDLINYIKRLDIETRKLYGDV